MRKIALVQTLDYASIVQYYLHLWMEIATAWGNDIIFALICKFVRHYLWIRFANDTNISIIIVIVVGRRTKSGLFWFLLRCIGIFGIGVAVAVEFRCTAECAIDTFGPFEVTRRTLMCCLIDFTLRHYDFGTFGGRSCRWTTLNRFFYRNWWQILLNSQLKLRLIKTHWSWLTNRRVL